MALAIIHLIALQDECSNNPLGIQSSTDKASFHYYYVLKDLYGAVILGIFLCLVIFVFPCILVDVDNFLQANPLVTPAHIKPE